MGGDVTLHNTAKFPKLVDSDTERSFKIRQMMNDRHVIVSLMDDIDISQCDS